MWKMAISELSHKPVHKGQKLLFMGSIKGVVQNIYWHGQSVRSAYFSASTKPIFRSESARFVIFIQMSKEMWDFDNEGSGDIMFSKVINGFLPGLFKRWTKMKARHLVSIVLFCRVEYQIPSSSAVMPLKTPQSTLKVKSKSYDTRDFYRVVVSETLCEDWMSILDRLKREFLVFLRDVSIMRNPYTNRSPSPESQMEVPEFIIAGHPSVSSDSNILEAINLACSQFSQNYIDRDLVRTGVSVIIISAGTGLYTVDYNMLKVTTDSLTANGIGVDLVCLSSIPLHLVPLFRYKNPQMMSPFYKYSASNVLDEGIFKQTQMLTSGSPRKDKLDLDTSSKEGLEDVFYKHEASGDDEWKYAMPHWIDISFWKNPSEDFTQNSHHMTTRPDLDRSSRRMREFTPRCRMYDLQMMGLMETDVSEISIPFLQEQNYNQVQELRKEPNPSKALMDLNVQKLRKPIRSSSPEHSLFSWTTNYDTEVFRPFNNLGGAYKHATSLVHESRPPKTVHRYKNDSLLFGSSYDGGNQRINSFDSRLGVDYLNKHVSERHKDNSSHTSRRESVSSKKSSNEVKMNHSSILNRQLSSSYRRSGAEKAIASSELTSRSLITTDFNKSSQYKASGPSHSAVSAQVRRALSRNPSQQGAPLTTMLYPEDRPEEDRSQPINIKKSSLSEATDFPQVINVKQSNNKPSKVLKDVDKIDILNAVSMTKQAGPKFNFLSGGFLSKGTTTSSPSKEPLPWLVVENPSNPCASKKSSNNHFCRWQHVFSRPLHASSIKWKSLCSPAAMPLTTNHFPSREQLTTEYHESPYKIYQNEDDELIDNYIFKQPLMMELVAFRLSHGFQLAIGDAVSDLATKVQNVFPNENSCQPGDVVFMSAGNNMHQLLCISNGEVEVRRYTQKSSATTGEPDSSSMATPYKPFIRTTSDLHYNEREMILKSTVEEYNWNYIDNYLAGYRDDFSDTLRFSRARFVLIPLEALSLPRESLEENQLDGIKQLTQLWQKHRYLSEDERQLQPPLRKKKDPNPLAIDFQTRNPSVIVTAAVVSGTDSLSLPEREPSLFPHIIDEAESYHTQNYDLRKLAVDLQEAKGIRMIDRRWHVILHHNCFVGSELTTWLLQNFDDIETRDEAVELGNRLMTEGLFQHVTRRHQFKDGNYFYQISSEYRLPKSETKTRWFSSKKSLPLAPAAEMRSDSTESLESRTRSSTETSDNSGVKTPTKSSAARNYYALSRKMRYDVDHKKKSYRPEIINLHYDLLHNPANCYHIRIDWMNVTAKLIEDVITSWTATAEKHYLNLVEVPIAEASSINKNQPFRSPHCIELVLSPPAIEIDHGSDLKWQGNLFNEKHYYQKKILQEHSFILDFEAASSFPSTANVVYSWGKPDYKYSQYVHQSGSVLAQITDEGNYLVLANRLCKSQGGGVSREATRHSKVDQDASRSTSGIFEGASPVLSPNAGHASSQMQNHSISAPNNKKLSFSAEQIICELDSFCRDEEILKNFYEENAKLELEEFSIRTATQSGTSSPAPKLISRSKELESIQGLSPDVPPSETTTKASSSPSSGVLQ